MKESGVQKGDLHVGAPQWAVVSAAAAAAAGLVYTNELRYELASPLLSRWFVCRRRNETSPLFIFFSTWNYEFAPYEVNQMLTRARENRGGNYTLRHAIRGYTLIPASRELAGWLLQLFQPINLQILCSIVVEAILYFVPHKCCTCRQSPRQTSCKVKCCFRKPPR